MCGLCGEWTRYVCGSDPRDLQPGLCERFGVVSGAARPSILPSGSFVRFTIVVNMTQLGDLLGPYLGVVVAYKSSMDRDYVGPFGYVLVAYRLISQHSLYKRTRGIIKEMKR
jgi:hypothetical protein